MDDLTGTALQSARLELDFERAKQEAERLYDEERARVLRVELLLQEVTNDELQERIEHIQDFELKHSENLVEDLQARLAEFEEQHQISQDKLKACMRDIDNYQAELNALNATQCDSSKALSEKLALQRELNNLKPELEHLRSMASTQGNVLADKLSLEREMSMMQVELDNQNKRVQRLKQKGTADEALVEELEDLKQQLAKERKQVQKLERQNIKRANEKPSADAALVEELDAAKAELEDARKRTLKAEQALQNATTQQAESTSTNTILEDLKNDLTKEKRALQKAEREAMKKTTEWETQKEALVTKLDAFRTKLRTTKEQLKEAQDELERREQAKFAESAAATKARITGRAGSAAPEPSQAAGNGKKRNIARFDPDMTIGTPGNGGPAAKKARLTGSNVGDKSTFSITPFLNKTLSILSESPNAVLDRSINELAEEAEQAARKEKAKESRNKAVVGSKVEASKEKASKPLKERANATIHAPSLARVVEEEDVEEVEVENAKPAETTADITSLQPKKKKLMGAARKNIFDDDEPGGIKKAGRTGLGKVNLGFGKNKTKMLAEFSPLKKERRMNETMVS